MSEEQVASEATEVVEESPAEEVVEEVTEEAPKEDRSELLSSRFAMLSRREKELREKEQSLKEREGKYKDFDALAEMAKTDPDAALEKMGLSYDQLTQYYLNEKKPTPEMVHSATQSEIEELKQWKAEQEKAKAQAAYDETIQNFKKEIGTFIEGSSLELTKASNGVDVVYDVIDNHYQETGKVLSIDEAAKHVENEFEKQVSAFLSTQKGKEVAQKLLTPSEPEEKAKPSSKTLTNEQATSAPTPRDKSLSEEESKERMAEMLRFT